MAIPLEYQNIGYVLRGDDAAVAEKAREYVAAKLKAHVCERDEDWDAADAAFRELVDAVCRL